MRHFFAPFFAPWFAIFTLLIVTPHSNARGNDKSIVANIVKLSGDVMAKSGFKRDGALVKLDDSKLPWALYAGGEVVTGKNGLVKVEFVLSQKVGSQKPNNVLVGSNSSLQIKAAHGASHTSGETILNLKRGSVRSEVNEKYSGEKGDVFEVHTPIFVAGVRGTVFQVDYDESEQAGTMATLEGQVAVRGLKGKMSKRIVNAGMYVLGNRAALQRAAAIDRDVVIQQKLDGLERSLREKGIHGDLQSKRSRGLGDTFWDRHDKFKEKRSQDELRKAGVRGALERKTLKDKIQERRLDEKFGVAVGGVPKVPAAGGAMPEGLADKVQNSRQKEAAELPKRRPANRGDRPRNALDALK